MPHTNEEMREKLFKLWKELRLEDKTSFEEIPAVIQIENFITKEISDLKKSIREEIESKKLKNLLEARDNGFNEEEEMFAFNQALDEILSLKSLE